MPLLVHFSAMEAIEFKIISTYFSHSYASSRTSRISRLPTKHYCHPLLSFHFVQSCCFASRYLTLFRLTYSNRYLEQFWVTSSCTSRYLAESHTHGECRPLNPSFLLFTPSCHISSCQVVSYWKSISRFVATARTLQVTIGSTLQGRCPTPQQSCRTPLCKLPSFIMFVSSSSLQTLSEHICVVVPQDRRGNILVVPIFNTGQHSSIHQYIVRSQ